MKSILIVDCNAKLGGIQKSLIAMLSNIPEDVSVSLLLFYKQGDLL